MNICLRCGYQWAGRIAKPKNCPRCKASRWDKVANPVGRPRVPEDGKNFRVKLAKGAGLKYVPIEEAERGED